MHAMLVTARGQGTDRLAREENRGISRIEPGSLSRTDHWRFTPVSCRPLFEDVFDPEQVSVESYRNVLAAVASLTGMAQKELWQAELDRVDPNLPVMVAVRAVKRTNASPHGSTCGAILAAGNWLI